MGYKPTGGKAGRPKKGLDSHGNPVQPPRPEPPGIALSVAEARRQDSVRALARELARLDSEPGVSMGGLPLPDAVRMQRQLARQGVAEKLDKLRGLTGYDLVAEFAPQMLPATERLPEPAAISEVFNRGNPLPVRFVPGGQVTPAAPDHMRQYQERRAAQEAEAERQARIIAGQEALALAALAAQEEPGASV
jgi:hypothetical protein